MATVEGNGKVSIMKYNDFTDDKIDISIRDENDDEVLLLDKETRFLYSILKRWIK